MYKLNDLPRWREIYYDYDESLSGPVYARVENGQYVTLRLRTVSAGVAEVFVTLFDDAENEDPTLWEGGNSYPLGTFEHFVEMQFWAPPGGFMLTNHRQAEIPAGLPSVLIDLAQGENWVQPPVEGESFARVMERAPRNEEYEQMLAVAMRNIDRRIAQERSETARVLAEMDRLHRAELAEARAVGTSDEGAGKPRKKVTPPPADGGSSDEAAGGDEGGGGGNDDNAVA